MTRIVAVTPAGRRGYLELLAYYVLRDESIVEWHLWDNCRQQSDREYINELAKKHEKIKVVKLARSDGTNTSINKFYHLCTEPDTFYIKMDDDLVYLPPGLGAGLYQAAIVDRGRYAWWSPLVINNATCTWMLKYFSPIKIAAEVTAQASCRIGWRNAPFAESLHRAFIGALRTSGVDDFRVQDQSISLARFSINCVGFFGSDVVEAGETFCPDDVDDEEWISAVLPAKLGRSARIIGNYTVAHFSYYPQEAALLKTNILDEYYTVAGLELTHRPVKKLTKKMAFKFAVLNRLLGWKIPLTIGR